MAKVQIMNTSHNYSSNEQKPTERQQYGAFIQRVIRHFQLNPNVPVRFADIADCDKRRQSDLYNILNALEIFGHLNDKFITWKGFGATTSALIRMGIRNEVLSHTQNMCSIFNVGTSPPLGILTMTFLQMFVYLGLPSLNIQEAVIIMASSADQVKKILRRLYLIVFILIQVGLLEHGNEHSLYILIQPLDLIISTIFQETLRLKMFPHGTIEELLNRLDANYLKNLHQRRLEEYRTSLNRFNNQK